MKEVSGVSPPAVIGKIVRVKLMYRPGCFGPVSVQYMSEYDCGQLQARVGAYTYHAKASKQPDTEPNRRLRREMQKVLGLPASPELDELPSLTFSFTRYEVKGVRKSNLQAAKGGLIQLKLKLIDNVEITETIKVIN